MRKFFSEHKFKLMASSLLILVPMVVGLILWDRLPLSMNIHWNSSGDADGIGAKAFVVFALPLILLAFHWIGMVITSIDPGNRNQNRKAIGLIFWIIPVISIFCNGLIFSSAFGKEIELVTISPVLLALLFIVIGNYMPKVKRNYSLGIKIKWTLENEENWTMTHRFAGKLWVGAGIVLLICLLLPVEAFVYLLIADILAVAFGAVLYSYFYYRKQLKRGDYVVNNSGAIFRKKGGIVGLIISIVIIIAVAFIMFTGEITYVVSENAFTVKADYYPNISVDIEEIDSIELRDDVKVGTRISGFSSLRMLLGSYRNAEFGAYTRYTYAKQDLCIVIKKGDKVLVISGKDETATEALYNNIISKR